MTLKGSFTLVLHSHLPYVLSHGRWPHGMDWLNEATAETYIPILDLLNQLMEEGHLPRVVIGITPVLTEQLAHRDFKEEFRGYLKNKIDAAKEDEKRFQEYEEPHMAGVARMWRDFYQSTVDHFTTKYKEDLVGAFKKLQDRGAIEIITSAATHGYLPILGEETSISAQIKLGVDTYRRHFDRQPRGIWLPECAYRPGYRWTCPIEGFGGPRDRKGVEEFLSENHLEYFFVDAHLLKGGKAIGVYLDRFEALKKLWGEFEKQYVPPAEDKERSPYELYWVGPTDEKRPVAIFTRDPRSSLQVWSGEWGYPGDGNYLDFHKKHFPGGLRYWRVTSSKSDLAEKEVYEPQAMEEKVRENAVHFKDLVKEILNDHLKETGSPGIVTAPFDTELFGHWWFEGTRWLYHVLKLMDQDPEIELTTTGEYLDKNPPSEVISLPEGSWGEGGFHWIWFNEWTRWTWKHVYEAEQKMRDIVREHAETRDSDLKRILTQLARELLLLESSDWQFLISTWSARDYAETRLTQHYQDFMRLYDLAQKRIKGEELHIGAWEFLGDIERRDSIFPEIDLKWWT